MIWHNTHSEVNPLIFKKGIRVTTHTQVVVQCSTPRHCSYDSYAAYTTPATFPVYIVSGLVSDTNSKWDLCVCVCVCVQACVCVHSCVHMEMLWRAWGSFAEVVFSFSHVGSGDWIPVLRLGSKHLYPLNHLAGPRGKLQQCNCFFNVLTMLVTPASDYSISINIGYELSGLHNTQ